MDSSSLQNQGLEYSLISLFVPESAVLHFYAYKYFLHTAQVKLTESSFDLYSPFLPKHIKLDKSYIYERLDGVNQS